jgi:hypothetical protein
VKPDSRTAFLATGVGYEYRRDTMKLVTTSSIAIADPVAVVADWPAREVDSADLIGLDSAPVRPFRRAFKAEGKVRGAKPEQGVVA